MAATFGSAAGPVSRARRKERLPLKTLWRSRMLAPMRPDKLMRTLAVLRRWGLTPAAAYGVAAICHPERTAIIDERGALTFGEVQRRTNALARLSRNELSWQMTLSVLIAALVVCGWFTAVPAADAAESGAISGKVTSAATKGAIAGIEVCAAESLFEAELFGHCAQTGSGGEYTISGLPAGRYGVGFFGPEGSGLNYIPQYYNGKSSVYEAEFLTVEAAQTVSGINAAMEVGGQIAGKVTSASTKAAITSIQVCASRELGEFGELAQCAKTNASGEYTVSGLVTGSYTVRFFGPEGSGLNYIPQYYNGKSSSAKANVVAVTAGSMKSEINAAMAPGGAITGKVTDASTKAALSGVSVCPRATTTEASFNQCATTNSSGEYTIVGLATGGYKVEFYPAGQNYLTQFYSGKSSESEASVVSEIAGSTTSGIDAAMVVGGQITGKVTDASTKAALSGIEVCLEAPKSTYFSSCVFSNVGGEYTFVGLATGEYKVEYLASNGANYVTQYYNGKSAQSEATGVSVMAGATTSGIDAAMVVGGQITGKVTSAATKAGIEGIEVCASPTSGGSGSCASTNSKGEYTIVALATGEYTIDFYVYNGLNYLPQYYNGKASLAEANAVAVTAGGTTSGIDAAMVAGGQITGKVTNSSSHAAVSGIWVCALTSSGGYSGHCATTNSGGDYTISGLATGEYKVEFSSGGSGVYFTQYYSGKAAFSEAASVAVTAAGVTSGIDAAMVEGGRITGTVTSAATKAGLEGVYVCANVGREEVFGRCAYTNSAGEYTIVGLAAGEYSLRFNPRSGNYLSQYYAAKSLVSEANLVSVADDATTAGINAALAAGAQVTGKVTSAASKEAIKGIEVCAWPAGESEVGGGCATTSATGEYTIESLPTGKYAVRFAAPYESTLNYLPQYYSAKSLFSEATPVSVTAGSMTSNIGAMMAVGGQISGKVTDTSSKAAIQSIQVCASVMGTGEGGGCTTTSETGEYTLRSLATGEYRVEFSAPYGSSLEYVEQYYNAKASSGEANPVSVTAGATVSGIDAAMVLKGQIAGKVTDATTKAAVGGIQVSVYQTTGYYYPIAYATTNSSGEYAVAGLTTGEYRIEFSVPYGSSLNYLPQYYNGKESLSSATLVSVSNGTVTSGINAAMRRHRSTSRRPASLGPLSRVRPSPRLTAAGPTNRPASPTSG
jgi:hypothetical protein